MDPIPVAATLTIGGPTGVCMAYKVIGEPKGVQLFGATGAQGPYLTEWRDGEWYAFRLRLLGRGDLVECFARVESDPSTGYLELTEIPNPYICRVCGEGYQEGAHTEFGFAGEGAHDYEMRGVPD
jgi:hypothetical protein